MLRCVEVGIEIGDRSRTAVMLVPVYLTLMLPQKQLPRGIFVLVRMDGEDWWLENGSELVSMRLSEI
jgi:hypothetical protein